MFSLMAELLQLIWSALTGLFRSGASRESEIAALRRRLNVLHRQARNRDRPNLGRQVYGETQKAAFARVENISAQLCRWRRGDGSVRRSDTHL